ncbi:hypothetical protein [Solirubrobacter soli]|uniref:hypothetical protein n=1 Tax=Solirubrobacter soli TaxID=363832 RepID=UPI00041E2276|nr:hypothetical protein [Solirubrobacter soli]
MAGRMTGLTLFTPIHRHYLWFMRIGLVVTRHLPFMARHILQFNFIKFVRWTVVKRLDGERLHYPYLFFESNFDGPWQHYIDAFAYVIPLDIRVTWGRGPGFPAPPPAEPLKAWIGHNSMEGGTYYCAHADASTREVNNALAVQERFEALRRDADQLSPEAFKAAWEAFLTDAQAHL